MKISFLLPDVNCPVLGPVIQLAGYLRPEFEVEIIGPDFGHGVCPMYREAWPVRAIALHRMYRVPEYWSDCRKLADAIRGDVVVAVKAFASTVPVALMAKRQRGVKVVAYLDEWDGALMKRLPVAKRVARWIRHAHHPLDDVYCPWVERMLPKCDLVLSTTTFLKNRFGGEILHLGVDTDVFKPQPPDRTAALKSELGLGNFKVIVFGGVVRPHKGIDLILRAIKLTDRSDVRLLIVGPRNEHVLALESDPDVSKFLIAIGPRPKSEMPRYLDLADLAILTLNDDLLAQSQMPCKVFEAMAMAKPIIASAVSDLPLVLDGAGLTIPPGDAAALASAIDALLRDTYRSDLMRFAARARCLKLYSARESRERLQSLLSRI